MAIYPDDLLWFSSNIYNQEYQRNRRTDLGLVQYRDYQAEYHKEYRKRNKELYGCCYKWMLYKPLPKPDRSPGPKLDYYRAYQREYHRAYRKRKRDEKKLQQQENQNTITQTPT